jgi:hypothetical protein
MKTQKEINQAFKTLLKVDLTGYPEGETPWSVFESEYPTNQEHHIIMRVKSWMLGLPSCLDMPYTYHEIGCWLSDNTGRVKGCFSPMLQDNVYWYKAAEQFVKLYQPK